MCRGGALTICWMRAKLLPWQLKACSKSTLSSSDHSSGKGVKLPRSARDFSTSCLCHSSIPSAWGGGRGGQGEQRGGVGVLWGSPGLVQGGGTRGTCSML